MRQLHAQVESFRERFERAAFHKNFEKLDQRMLDSMVEKAKRLGAQNRYEAALEQMDTAFDLCTEGLSYYQVYSLSQFLTFLIKNCTESKSMTPYRKCRCSMLIFRSKT